MTHCQSITKILRTIWVRCIPLSMRSKTRRRATPLLPTWIYSCRSRVTVSCELPFTTNVTISISIAQTFFSWVAIFLLRQRCLISQLIRYARACSSYECFILRAARLSSKLLGQGYVMERLKSSLKKFYGRYGDLIKYYEVSPSQKLHDILGHDRIQWHPQLVRLYINLQTHYWTGLYFRFWPYFKILDVSIEHCNGCGQPREDVYSSRHLVLSHFWLAFVLMLRPFLNLSCLTTFWVSNIPRYFYLALKPA